MKAELHLGLVTDTKGITVGQFLDQWMNHKRVSLKPKSIEDYSWVIEHRLKPLIGRILLEKLKVLDIEHMVRSVREKTSPNAAKRARTVLRMALGQAVKWQMVPRNLADIVDVPKVEKKEMHVWEPGQVTRFLAVVQVHRLYALFHLALTTGMRCGELLALRWQDINWDKSTLQVRLTANEIRGHITFSTPKTPAAIRAIHLSPSTMEMLKAHHSRQARERQALEGGWTDSGLVFTSDVGTTLSKRKDKDGNFTGWKGAIVVGRKANGTLDRR